MEKIELQVTGLSYSQTHTGAYTLVLSEKNGKRKLPVIIGGFEAQAIAIELESMTPSRPLTHDLAKNIFVNFGIEVTEVFIYQLTEGVFFSKISCKSSIKEIEVDARTSDAIALAVRYNCPIYTHETILSTAGILMEEGETGIKPKTLVKPKEQKKSSYQNFSIEELEDKLKKAIEIEAYEEAAKIQSEIDKKKKNNN